MDTILPACAFMLRRVREPSATAAEMQGGAKKPLAKLSQSKVEENDECEKQERGEIDECGGRWLGAATPEAAVKAAETFLGKVREDPNRATSPLLRPKGRVRGLSTPCFVEHHGNDEND